MILQAAVGRARVGCVAVRWQGATTQRASARKKEQRSQSASTRPNRVCSALTQQLGMVVSTNLDLPLVLPAVESGQLPLPG